MKQALESEARVKMNAMAVCGRSMFMAMVVIQRPWCKGFESKAKPKLTSNHAILLRQTLSC
jgi:hypothetical protein